MNIVSYQHRDTHTHTHSLEVLLTGDQPVAETSTVKSQHSQETDIHPQRNSNLQSQQATMVEPRLTSRGHRDRLSHISFCINCVW
jgi:hypothetical protein